MIGILFLDNTHNMYELSKYILLKICLIYHQLKKQKFYIDKLEGKLVLLLIIFISFLFHWTIN